MNNKKQDPKGRKYDAPEISTYSGADVETALGPAQATYGALP